MAKNNKMKVRFSNGEKNVVIIDKNYEFQDNGGKEFLGYVTRSPNGYAVVTVQNGKPILINPLEIALIGDA